MDGIVGAMGYYDIITQGYEDCPNKISSPSRTRV